MVNFSEQSVTEVRPEPSATVIVARDGEAGIEVLLLQRNPELAHMPGFWVFPGGKVDAEDAGDHLEERARLAAARELHEEAGLEVSPEGLMSFSHWLTPANMKRRFATWFYLLALPCDASIRVDGSEIVDYQWLSPAQAIAHQRAGELQLPPPTVVSLVDVGHHDSVAALSAMVAGREPPYFFPKIIPGTDTTCFLYPGDAGYDSGNPDLKDRCHRTLMTNGAMTYHRDFDWPLREG